MSNIIIAFPNRADEAALSGGDWLTLLPLSNLQNRRLRKVARSAGADLVDTQFDIDLAVSRTMKVIALVGHNLSVDARYRITAANNAGFTGPVYQSDWENVWPAMFQSENLEWEDDNFWDGRIPDEFISGYPSILLHQLSGTFARYWRIEIDDTLNPDGWVEAGRLFMAEHWQPVYNFAYGAGFGFLSRTTVEESDGGAEYFGIKRAARIYNFTLPNITASEVYDRVFEMQRRVDVHGEILVIPDPDDENNRTRRSFLARMLQLNPIEQRAFGLHSAPFSIKELI